MQNTYEVDNYPGLPGVSGMELAEKFRAHAENISTEFVRAEVTGITEDEGVKTIHTKDGNYRTKSSHSGTGSDSPDAGRAGRRNSQAWVYPTVRRVTGNLQK